MWDCIPVEVSGISYLKNLMIKIINKNNVRYIPNEFCRALNF